MIAYHGTTKAFATHYRENGMAYPHTPASGERFTDDIAEAKRHSKAWCAYVLFTEGLPPDGMIVKVDLPPARIQVDRHGILRVAEVAPHELALLGPVKFRDLDPRVHGRGPFATGEPDDSFFRNLEAELEEWERLTDRKLSLPFPRQRARRS